MLSTEVSLIDSRRAQIAEAGTVRQCIPAVPLASRESPSSLGLVQPWEEGGRDSESQMLALATFVWATSSAVNKRAPPFPSETG